MENSVIEKSKTYIAMICLQFGYAGMNIVTKVSLNGGFSHYVLVVYRQAFATVIIAPFALLLERKVRPKMTLPIFMQIFALALLGPVIDQNLYYAGLKLTSPTFSCAMSNMLPAMAFLISLVFRIEKLGIKKLRWQAKLVGTLLTVAGAIMMTLYKGHVITMLLWNGHILPENPSAATAVAVIDKEWVKGSLLLIFATLAWAAFIVLQVITLKQYPAQLSLTAMVCSLGTLQSAALTFVMEHRPSVWTVGLDMNLFAAAYAGIISSGIAYYVQGLVTEKKGPIFVTAFNPLMMIIVAFMSSFILAEKLFVGSVVGAVLIVMGLCSILWGTYKSKDTEEIIFAKTIPIGANNNNNHMTTIFEEIEPSDVESQKIEPSKGKDLLQAIEIRVLKPQPPIEGMEEEPK